MKYLKLFRPLSAISLVIIALVFLLTACTSAPVTITQTPTLPATELAPTPSLVSDIVVDFIPAVNKIMPAVVKIEASYGSQGAPGNPSATGSAGTGWVIRQDGLIVTNNHVVNGAQTVTVIMPDGSQLTPTSIKADPGKDLAVLKVTAQNLPVAPTGDSAKLEQGQPVAAIGNALDLGIRITSGVVSQLNVPVNYNNISLRGLIETDATINPGNSGGPLITMQGEVVGIVNAGLQAPNLDAENFGYAISINEAMPAITNLIAQIP